MPTRRQVLQLGAAFGAASALGLEFGFKPNLAWAFYQSPMGLKKFVQPLRGVGPGGIPVAAPDAFRAPVTGVLHYSFTIDQFTDRLHPSPDLDPTPLWGYNPVAALGGGVQPQRHLGGIIVAKRGQPIQLTFTNRLPPKHILPVDTSRNFPDAARNFGGRGHNATTTHLHGGHTPWSSDGGPRTWFTPGGNYGPSAQFTRSGSVVNVFRLLNPGLKAGQGEYYYPNDLSARLMWYHDHAQDITRLNAYAGIASACIMRDDFEGNLRNFGLPEFIENGGKFELPIVIQDKIFVGPDIATKDPTWPGPKTAGSLWYPHVYETDRWELEPDGTPLHDPSVIPEMFGDTMLANGTVFPEVTVEPRLYRLRVLDACQARFLNLQLYVDNGSPDGITLTTNSLGTLVPTNAKGPDFLVIGTDGGFLFLPTLVPSNRPLNISSKTDSHGNTIYSIQGGSLVTAPAERWDLLVDFGDFAGKNIILYNDAPAPYPGGDPLNDYFPGAPHNPTQPVPGFGPNTRQIMRFNVGASVTSQLAASTTALTHMDMKAGLPAALVPATLTPLPPPPGIKVRQLTLNEAFDEYGRLVQLLGTNQPTPSGRFGRAYTDPPTETPRAGAIEVWQIANLTADTHPIHFHLVDVQLLSRRPFDVGVYNGSPSYTGPARGPLPTELGFKETVKAHPNEVTTVIMKFDLPTVPFALPSSPLGGAEYVWHCHILEHEEHDMMRPLVVI